MLKSGKLAGPVVAVWEITTGTNIYGEDIGLVGRGFALAGVIPGAKIAGKLVKAIRKVDDVAEVAVKQSTERTADLAQKAVRHGDHALEAVGDASRQSSKRAQEVAEEARERAAKKKKQEADPCPNLSLAAVAESSNLAAAVTNGDGCGVPNLSGSGNHSKPAKVEVEGIDDAIPEISRTNYGPEHGKGNVEHNNAIEDYLDTAKDRGAADLRKNRVQRDASGKRVFDDKGKYTRPDGSYVEDGVRHNYNRVSNSADIDREIDAFLRMIEADPKAINQLEF